MRKPFSILIIYVILFNLAGCSSGDRANQQAYELVQENGQYYMILDAYTETTDSSPGQNDVTGLRSIQFSSAAEMKHDIQTGDFTEEELGIIATFRPDETGRVPICDPSSLYEPRCPSGYGPYRIYWREAYYYFGFDAKPGSPCFTIDLMDESLWMERKDYYFNFTERIPGTVHSVTTEEDRNATVCVYDDKIGKPCKAIYYTISTEDHLLYVWEKYYTEEDAHVPESVLIYGQRGTAYFSVVIWKIQTRPSVEWLSQFGLTPYLG